MSNPKRKVTDLLPTEAILISSDAERDEISKLLDDLNIRWCGGERLVYYKASMAYPYCFTLDENLIWHDSFGFCKGVGKTIYPATDFIPTESDEVEVGDIEAELTNLKRYELNTCSGSDGVCWSEMEQSNDGDYVLWSDIEQLLKTRNTPNQ